MTAKTLHELDLLGMCHEEKLSSFLNKITKTYK